MAITNYSELKASIADWLNRQDLTAVIPDFIRLLEAQVERTLRVRQMLKSYDATLVAGDNRITLPSDFLSVQELRVFRASDGQVIPLSYANRHEQSEHLALTANASGRPQSYMVGNNIIEFAPVADQNYTIKLFYWATIPKLSGAVTSNWLLERHPDVYLYGSLLQAAPYLKHDERVPLWSDALATLLEEIRVQDERATAAGVPLKMRIKPYG